VSAVAGQGTYTWSFDTPAVLAGWTITAGQGTNQITYTAGAQAGTAHLSLHVENAFHCTSDCSVDITCLPPNMDFCTLTQGAYGNSKGKFNGVGRVALIKSLLDAGPVTLGKTTGSPANYITFANPTTGSPNTTANCIIAVMPAGGTPSALPNGTALVIDGSSGHTCSIIPSSGPGDLLDNGKFNNVLIGQVLALSLNLRLDMNHLGAQTLCSVLVTRRALPGPDHLLGTADDVLDPNDLGHNFLIPDSVICQLTSIGNVTVQGLLDLANCALAGQSTGVASIADINAAVDAINEGFDECRFLVREDCHTIDCDGLGTLLDSKDVGGQVVAQARFPFEVAPFASSMNLFRADSAHTLFGKWAAALVDAKTNPAYFSFRL